MVVFVCKICYNENMRVYLFLAIFAAAVSSASLILTLFFIDPFQADHFLIVLFYVCLFAASAGIFFLLGILFRKKNPYQMKLFMSFRQGVFFATIIVGLLAMKDFNVLRLWNGLILAGGIVGVEMYFSYKY